MELVDGLIVVVLFAIEVLLDGVLVVSVCDFGEYDGSVDFVFEVDGEVGELIVLVFFVVGGMKFSHAVRIGVGLVY